MTYTKQMKYMWYSVLLPLKIYCIAFLTFETYNEKLFKRMKDNLKGTRGYFSQTIRQQKVIFLLIDWEYGFRNVMQCSRDFGEKKRETQGKMNNQR